MHYSQLHTVIEENRVGTALYAYLEVLDEHAIESIPALCAWEALTNAWCSLGESLESVFFQLMMDANAVQSLITYDDVLDQPMVRHLLEVNTQLLELVSSWEHMLQQVQSYDELPSEDHASRARVGLLRHAEEYLDFLQCLRPLATRLSVLG